MVLFIVLFTLNKKKKRPVTKHPHYKKSKEVKEVKEVKGEFQTNKRVPIFSSWRVINLAKENIHHPKYYMYNLYLLYP